MSIRQIRNGTPEREKKIKFKNKRDANEKYFVTKKNAKKKIYFSVRWGGGKFETFCGPDKTLVCVILGGCVHPPTLPHTGRRRVEGREREKEERGGACSGGMNTPEFFFAFFLYFFGSVSRQDAVESRDRAPFSSLSLSLRLLFLSCSRHVSYWTPLIRRVIQLQSSARR